MTRVWKYEVPVTDAFKLMLPSGALALTVQMQDKPQMWLEVNPEADLESYWFFVVGTGNPKPAEAIHYLGTWQQCGYVWHLYSEEIPRR